MPVFNYRAVDGMGRPFTGRINARDISEARQKIADRGLVAVRVKEGSEFLYRLNKLTNRKPGIKFVAAFCRQLQIIVSSGINILNGLDVLRRQTGNKSMKRTVAKIFNEVQKGRTLSEAMGDEEVMLPELLVSMVSVGEVSGNLDEILNRMAEYYEKENHIRQKLLNAMIYPVVLIIVGILMMVFFMIFVLPQIISVIQESGGELPGVTRFIINMSDFLKRYFLFVVAFLGIVFASVRAVVPETSYRLARDRILIRLPLVKDGIRNIVTARFMRTMSIMIKGGIPLLRALDATEKVMRNAIVESGIRHAAERIKRGERLGDNLASCGFFEPLAIHMVNIGEETGGLDNILELMADYYDREAETALSKMMAAVEPAFTIVIGLFIGFIIVSMMMPLFSMVSQLNQ